MARVLRATVLHRDVEYAAGTRWTSELAEVITNPNAWEGEPDPEPVAPSAPAAVTPPAPSADQGPAEDQKRDEDSDDPDSDETDDAPDTGEDDGADPTPAASEPPRSGRGSGVTAWQAYATSLGITYPAEATRDELIELVDARTK